MLLHVADVVCVLYAAACCWCCICMIMLLLLLLYVDVYMLWGDRQAPLRRHFGGVAPAALPNLYSTVMCGRPAIRCDC